MNTQTPTPMSSSTEALPAPRLAPASSRQWKRGVGRAIGSVGDIVCGTESGAGVRSSLPVQTLAVVDIRVRPGSVTAFRGTHDVPEHIERAIMATLDRVTSDPLEVQVMSVRSDTPYVVGSQRESAEAVAASRAAMLAVGAEVDPAAVSSVVSGLNLSDGATSLAFPGIAVMDQKGTPARSWDWYPQFAVLRLLPASSSRLSLSHGDVTGIMSRLDRAVADRSPEDFASAVTAAADTLTSHPSHSQLLDAVEVLEAHGHPVLGYILSVSGPSAGILFPGDMSGRNTASAAAHILAGESAGQLRTAVTITPRLVV